MASLILTDQSPPLPNSNVQLMVPRRIRELHISLIHVTPPHTWTCLLHAAYGFSISAWNALLKSQRCINLFHFNYYLFCILPHELECKRGRRGRRRDNMCEKAKDNANQINNLKNFSGHKFVWEQVWGLVTQSWIWGGPEKKNISTFFSCNLYIFNFFGFFFGSFFLSAQLFLTIGLWVRPFDTVGFRESYQRYCEMKCNYVSVSGCEPKGVWRRLNEQLSLWKLEQVWCAFKTLQKKIFTTFSPFCPYQAVVWAAYFGLFAQWSTILVLKAKHKSTFDYQMQNHTFDGKLQNFIRCEIVLKTNGWSV